MTRSATSGNRSAISVAGNASGTTTNFEFNNIGPLKLQNVTGVFATGKVLLKAPPGKYVFPPEGGTSPEALLDSALAALLQAQDTQKDADEAAEKRKEEDEKREREDQKKKGTKSCS